MYFDYDDNSSLRSISGIEVRSFKFSIYPEQFVAWPEAVGGKPVFNTTTIQANQVNIEFQGGDLNDSDIPWEILLITLMSTMMAIC